MKLFSLFLGLVFVSGPLGAQKTPAILASNLNLSKSNINRLIYPGNLLTPANAQALLADLDKINPPDEAGLKTWLAANFKRFGIEPGQIKQMVIFNGKQFADCTICKQNCKGRCVKDPGSDCVCMYTSEPNLRVTDQSRPIKIIYFSGTVSETADLMEVIAKVFEAQPAGTKTN
jgi:hypothetical protein